MEVGVLHRDMRGWRGLGNLYSFGNKRMEGGEVYLLVGWGENYYNTGPLVAREGEREGKVKVKVK